MLIQWQEELGASYVEDIATIFIDYQQLYTANKIEEEVYGRSQHEVEFNIPIGKLIINNKQLDVYFTGVIDEVLITETGIGGIVEHKTFNQRPNPLFLTMNTQIALYAKAYKHLYKRPLQRVVWDYVKSTPATEPALLKSGKLSEAATKSVTPYSYRRACARHGLTPDPAKENVYAYNFEEFFFRRTIEVNPLVVKKVWKDFKITILDMIKSYQGKSNTVQHITKDCSWCDYRDICMVEFGGGETKDIIEEKFEKKGENA